MNILSKEIVPNLTPKQEGKIMKSSTFIFGPIGLLALFSVLVLVSTVGPTPRVSARLAPLVDPANNFTVVNNQIYIAGP